MADFYSATMAYFYSAIDNSGIWLYNVDVEDSSLFPITGCTVDSYTAVDGKAAIWADHYSEVFVDSCEITGVGLVGVHSRDYSEVKVLNTVIECDSTTWGYFTYSNSYMHIRRSKVSGATTSAIGIRYGDIVNAGKADSLGYNCVDSAANKEYRVTMASNDTLYCIGNYTKAPIDTEGVVIIIDSSFDSCMLDGGMGKRIFSDYFDDSLTDEGNVSSDRIKIVEDDFDVGDPYPNPFSSTSSIIFPVFCPRDRDVSLAIYNILGEEIATLKDSKPLKGNERYFIWDGMTAKGNPAPSGVYIFKVNMGNRSKAKKMMYMRR